MKNTIEKQESEFEKIPTLSINEIYKCFEKYGKLNQREMDFNLSDFHNVSWIGTLANHYVERMKEKIISMMVNSLLIQRIPIKQNMLEYGWMKQESLFLLK